jgi:hypothetical protein
MTQHWLHQSLCRWAVWYATRMLDKSMGYPKTSPIANFGMPPSTGNVWDSTSEQDWSDAEELHMLLKRLGDGEFALLVTYYVDTHCSYRKTGKAIGATHKTIKGWLELVLMKVDRMMVEKTTVQKPLERLTV